MAGLLAEWHKIDPRNEGMTCAKVIERIDATPATGDLAELLRTLAGEKPRDGSRDKRSHNLGLLFRKNRGRVFSGSRSLRQTALDRNGISMWAVASAGDAGNAGDTFNPGAEENKLNRKTTENIPRIPRIPRTDAAGVRRRTPAGNEDPQPSLQTLPPFRHNGLMDESVESVEIGAVQESTGGAGGVFIPARKEIKQDTETTKNTPGGLGIEPKPRPLESPCNGRDAGSSETGSRIIKRQELEPADSEEDDEPANPIIGYSPEQLDALR